MKVVVTVLVLVLLFSVGAKGQSIPSSNDFRKNSLSALAKLYDNALGNNSSLYNGKEYIDLYRNKPIEGHPYYLSDEPLSGSVLIEDTWYYKISIRYNLFQNSVVVEHPKTHREIELIQERISSFQLNEITFVRLTEPEPGYYAQLYSGEIKFYGRYLKTIQERVDNKTKITAFIPKNRYYLVKDNTFHAITSKSSVLKILEDQKSELRKFLNQENISYRKNREYALRRLGEKYDQLTQAR